MLNEVLNKRVNFKFIQNRDALYGVFKAILREVYILKPRYVFTRICLYINLFRRNDCFLPTSCIISSIWYYLVLKEGEHRNNYIYF